MIEESRIFKQLNKKWYVPLLVGILFILIGSYWMFNTTETLETFVFCIGISLLVSGIFDLFTMSQKSDKKTLYFNITILSISQIGMGLLFILNPKITHILLSGIVCFLIFIRSVDAISYAFGLKKYQVKDWWISLIFGICGILLAFLIMQNPEFSGMTLIFWISVLLILFGVLNIFFALKMKKVHQILDSIQEDFKLNINILKEQITSKMKENKNY